MDDARTIGLKKNTNGFIKKPLDLFSHTWSEWKGVLFDRLEMSQRGKWASFVAERPCGRKAWGAAERLDGCESQPVKQHSHVAGDSPLNAALNHHRAQCSHTSSNQKPYFFLYFFLVWSRKSLKLCPPKFKKSLALCNRSCGNIFFLPA